MTEEGENNIFEKLDKLEKIQMKQFYLALFIGTVINITVALFIHSKK